MDVFFKKRLYTIHVKMPIKPLINTKITIFLYRSNSTSLPPTEIGQINDKESYSSSLLNRSISLCCGLVVEEGRLRFENPL